MPAASQSARNDSSPLGMRTLVAYGGIGFPLALIGYPIAVWLPAFYAGELGVSLAAVGTMIMMARFTDVITDPLIGEASDRTRTRLGRRKPYLLLGTPVMMLGILCLFHPPADVGPGYLLGWLAFMMLGSTLIGLPYAAWGAELSGDYHQRSRVVAVREVWVLTGLLVAALIPAVVQQYAGAAAAPVLRAMGWAIVATLPLAVLAAVLLVAEPRRRTRHSFPFVAGLRLIGRNGPMKRVLLIVFIVVGGEAFRNALSLFFIRDVIGLPKVGSLYLLYFGAGLAAIPFWLWLGKRYEKHRALGVCLLIVSAISVSTFFLGRGDELAFSILFTAKGFCFGGLQFLPLAMLADVVDYDTARSGRRRAGVFFGFESMTGKIARAVGTGIPLNLAAWAGFDPSGRLDANGPAELTSLAVLYALLPAVFFVGAFWLTWRHPLTAARQAKLRRIIERRRARSLETLDVGSRADASRAPSGTMAPQTSSAR